MSRGRPGLRLSELDTLTFPWPGPQRRVRVRSDNMAPSMFQRYGGFAKLSKMVLGFYDRILDSDVVGPYFDGVDMGRLVDHQTKFVGQVMGGPVTYTDEHLAQLHAHLGIDDQAFDEMLAILGETLNDFGFEPGDVDSVLGEIGRRRGWIVSRPGGSRGASRQTLGAS